MRTPDGFRFEVETETSDGLTVEEFLIKKASIRPRAKLKKCFLAKEIFVNERVATRLHAVKQGDVVHIRSQTVYTEDETAIAPNQTLNVRTLAKTENFLVIDKPSRVHSHPQHPLEHDSALNAMVAIDARAASPLREDRPLEGGLLHRLDFETSGLLICALNEEAFHTLKNEWTKDSTEKVYLALVEGDLKQSGTIECALTHSDKNKKLMKVATKNAEAFSSSSSSWMTKTSFLNLSYFPNENVSLVLVRIFTGVTHQIRVVLASLGHPLKYDALYANTKKIFGETNPLSESTRALFQKLSPSVDLQIDDKSADKHTFFLRCIWCRIPSLKEGAYQAFYEGIAVY